MSKKRIKDIERDLKINYKLNGGLFMTKREVLLLALSESLRPLEDSIVELFCEIYNCSKKEIRKPIDIGRLVDMANSIIQQQTLEESVKCETI